jgi:hypothetical protein
MDVVAGGCQIQDGCDKSCFRFRPDPENALLCGHCKHDISNHKIIGIFHEGKFFPVGENATAAPQVLELHESAEEERKRIFKTRETRDRSRQSVGNKRKITADAEVPRRLSGGRNSAPAVASRPLNMAAKVIAMKRDSEVPQTIFDHTELGLDYLLNVELTTAKNFTSFLKMTSTLGEHFSKKWYLYTRLTNKTLKPTQYWSKNWPSDRVIESLCLEKFLYIIPYCFDDEQDNFVSEDDDNYVQILPSYSSSSSSASSSDASSSASSSSLSAPTSSL